MHGLETLHNPGGGIERSAYRLLYLLLLLSLLITSCTSPELTATHDQVAADLSLLLVDLIAAQKQVDREAYLREVYPDIYKTNVQLGLGNLGDLLRGDINEVVLNNDDDALIAIARAVLEDRGQHPAFMYQFIQDLADAWGWSISARDIQTVDLLSIIGRAVLERDKDGNPMVHLTIEPEPLIQEIQERFSQLEATGEEEPEIIMLPFQMGPTGLIINLKETKYLVGGLEVAYGEIEGQGYYVLKSEVPQGGTVEFISQQGEVLAKIRDYSGIFIESQPAQSVSDYAQALVDNDQITLEEAKDYVPITEVVHDEPLLEVLEAYSPVHGYYDVESNLRQLIKVCNAFPDKVIVAAVGNYENYFAQIKISLMQQGMWPDNLLLVSYATVSQNEVGIAEMFTNTDAADLYVKDARSSSQAVAETGTVLAWLLEQGFTPKQALDMMTHGFSSDGVCYPFELDPNGSLFYNSLNFRLSGSADGITGVPVLSK